MDNSEKLVHKMNKKYKKNGKLKDGQHESQKKD